MKKLFSNLWKRIVKHKQTTIKGILYGGITYLYFTKHITTTDWIAGTGSILTINSIFFQKDPDKVMNKPDEERYYK
jgi:hypothetical protein